MRNNLYTKSVSIVIGTGPSMFQNEISFGPYSTNCWWEKTVECVYVVEEKYIYLTKTTT